jgi:secreted trypsin-like serine protease
MLACQAGTEDVSTGKGAIVGGSEAREGAWPGTVALYFGQEQGCGGSLIADQWVLTAGHCVSPSMPTGGIAKVVIGRHDLTTTTGEERTVDRVIRHEGFDWNLHDDLALLHLTEPTSAPKVKLVSQAQIARVIDGAGVTVVGWGATGESDKTSNVLMQVTVPILPRAQCAAFESYANVTDDMICAGFVTGEYDSCQGDSGGPLFMRIDGQPVQIGLVSWGIGCARPNAPGVYTRLSSFLGWLSQKTDGAVGGPIVTDGGASVDAGPAPDPTPATDAGQIEALPDAQSH